MPAEQPTTADTLHQAAQLMRDRANTATPGPWTAAGLFAPAEGCRCMSCTEDQPWAWEVAELDGPDSGDCIHPMHISQADAEHIAAAADPTTVLALADWLDGCAALSDMTDTNYLNGGNGQPTGRHWALAVARAYLGTTAQVTA